MAIKVKNEEEGHVDDPIDDLKEQWNSKLVTTNNSSMAPMPVKYPFLPSQSPLVGFEKGTGMGQGLSPGMEQSHNLQFPNVLSSPSMDDPNANLNLSTKTDHGMDRIIDEICCSESLSTPEIDLLDNEKFDFFSLIDSPSHLVDDWVLENKKAETLDSSPTSPEIIAKYDINDKNTHCGYELSSTTDIKCDEICSNEVPFCKEETSKNKSTNSVWIPDCKIYSPFDDSGIELTNFGETFSVADYVPKYVPNAMELMQNGSSAKAPINLSDINIERCLQPMAEDKRGKNLLEATMIFEEDFDSKSTDEKINSFLNLEEGSVNLNYSRDLCTTGPTKGFTGNDKDRPKENNVKISKIDPQTILKAFESQHGKEGKPKVIEKATFILPARSKRLATLSPESSEVPQPKIILNIESSKASEIEWKEEPVRSSHETSVPSNPGPSTSYINLRKRKIESVEDNYNSILNESTYEEEPVSLTPKAKRKGKCSLAGLSEAEKYRRIREQNNKASKKCREKKKNKANRLLEELNVLEVRRRYLEQEVALYEEKNRKWKELYFAMIRST